MEAGGGRGRVDAGLGREQPGGHRRALRDVLLDQQLEHPLRTFVEAIFRLLSHPHCNLTVAPAEPSAGPCQLKNLWIFRSHSQAMTNAVLRSLTVRDFALVDVLDIELAGGLTVITGESGAGKSILLGALGLVTRQTMATVALLAAFPAYFGLLDSCWHANADKCWCTGPCCPP